MRRSAVKSADQRSAAELVRETDASCNMATGRGVGPGTYDRSLRWETDGAASAFVSGSARGGIDFSFSYPSPGDYSPTLSWHSDIGCTAAFRSKSIRKMSQAAWGTPGPGAYHVTAVAPSHLAQRGIKRPPPRTTWEWTRVATTPSIPSHSLSIEGEQALVVVVPVRCSERCVAVDAGACLRACSRSDCCRTASRCSRKARTSRGRL